MDHETNLLPEVADTPADMDSVTVSRQIEAAVEEAAAPIPEREASENMAAADRESEAPEGITAVVCEEKAAEDTAPAVAEEAKAECSFLLDPEISALLGAEVSAILEADWARANGRTVPAKASPIRAEVPKEAAPAKAAPVGDAKSAKVKTAKSQKAEPADTGKVTSPAESEKPKKKRSLGRKIFCFVRRTLLLVVVLALLVVAAAAMACHTIFNGPSQDAREMLYNTFMEPSGTKWIPGLFLSKEEIDAIENKQTLLPPTPDISGQITINTDTALNGENDEWKDHPDGIRIEHITGESYTAHVMIIRDPSRVYLGTSNRDFTNQKPGMQLNKAMEKFGASAGINGGAFWDNGTGDAKVGTTPEGLVISQGQVLWNQKDTYFPDNGFAGFNQDNVLIVAKSMTRAQAMELGIRDGVAFGPVLIVDGKGNAEVYNNKSGGQNPRTCIGQRADGAVIFLCIDGRQANSLGGTYADCIDILTEYGAVNACNLDGGSSSTMFYRDTYGKYEEKGSVFMVNNYSLLASEPRRMPTFFLVAPMKEAE